MAYSDRELLARIVQCEAGGEGDNGMKAVATVVLNRVNATEGEYARISQGGNIRNIIYQKGQFDCATETLLKDSYTEGDNFATITPDYITYANAEGEMLKSDGSEGTPESPAEQKIFALSAGVTKVRVYMWIEGQDVDCENNASGTDISYNLQFTIDNV